MTGLQPRTASVDGWAATHHAWLTLFPLVALLRCFLHDWLNIRSRAELSETFAALSERVWLAYHAPKELRAADEEAVGVVEGTREGGGVLEQVKKLCGRSNGHRTIDMLDRLMRSMSRYTEDCQHLHGGEAACESHRRAWALLHNFRPWHPATARANGAGEARRCG